jgi:hypothetical protein
MEFEEDGKRNTEPCEAYALETFSQCARPEANRKVGEAKRAFFFASGAHVLLCTA